MHASLFINAPIRIDIHPLERHKPAVVVNLSVGLESLLLHFDNPGLLSAFAERLSQAVAGMGHTPDIEAAVAIATGQAPHLPIPF